MENNTGDNEMIIKIPNTDIGLDTNNFHHCLSQLKKYTFDDSDEWKIFYIRFTDSFQSRLHNLQTTQLMLNNGTWGFRKWILIDLYSDLRFGFCFDLKDSIKYQPWYDEWQNIKQFYI